MKSFQVHRADTVLDEAAYQFFCENGYVVLDKFLTIDEVSKAGDLVLELASFEKQSGKSHVYGENLQRVWNLLNKNVFFHELLLSPQIELWMNKIFDRNTIHQKFFLSSFQANILYPGARAQILHIDTPIPEPLPPYAIKANTIFLLDDFTEENGATEIIPGSHRNVKRPSRVPTEDDENALIKVKKPRGSMIISHGNLWHRSGDNKSSHKRRALLGSFAASYMREIACEDDAARFLTAGMRQIMNPRLYAMIGGNHGVKPGNNY